MKNNHDSDQITPIGITDWRNEKKSFGIKDNDRLGHIYVIGKTGVGKTTLLENMAISDIQKGKGCAIIDPHGDISDDILNYVPKHRIHDVIYFNAADTDLPIAYNPLFGINVEYHHLVASGLISTFKKIWMDSWGPRLEYILKWCLITLLEYGNGTLLDIQKLLTIQEYRELILSQLSNNDTLSFWKNEFEKFSTPMRNEIISPILNKMGIFLTCKPLKCILEQKKRSFSMQEIIEERKIFIANLSKGLIGEDATAILGSMLISSFQLATLHRARMNAHDRKPFFLFIDEAQTFLTSSVASILSESRKYGLSIFIAHQYINQLSETIRSAVFGNVGTMISFRVGAEDARYLVHEFAPLFSEKDFVNLPKHSMYIKLMIDGSTSKPFSATTKKVERSNVSYKENVVNASRNKYG
ncbi:MAG: hypothetical protein DWQ44_09780 [Bacteroidetes bacterium]|nr:MAG: hypothetical protein DWQ33_10055 [Bacteroidota bacterium]REK06572.1 MAG: hypothetical protein DWQ39_03570 [Bacteroidota bacterium]REK33338.1 MAG: hypothetical protein DWQ44_09780 [Bacteroidota bacterium]REK49738.1 MAG: hypothetical protein DWQ48_06335 [Bacteroidota bacterium]